MTHLRSEMNLLQVSEELQKTLQLGFWEMSIKEWIQNDPRISKTRCLKKSNHWGNVPFLPCDRVGLYWRHLHYHGWIMAALPDCKTDLLLIRKRQLRGKWKFKSFNNHTRFIMLLKCCWWELNDWITWGALVKAASGGSTSPLFREHLSRAINYKEFLFNCQTEFSVFLRRWVDVDPGVSPFSVIGFDL